jgi:protein-disulfide isomerase
LDDVPSGKRSKRRRQAAVAAPPPARRQASPRVLLAGLAAIALIVIGIVLGVVLSHGSGDGSSAANTSTLPGAVDVQQLFEDIPQHDNVLGRPSAPVTMVEWVDLQCPYCQQFEMDALPNLILQYVRTGKVKIQVNFIGYLGPDSQRGRLAALAAGMQDKLFNLVQLLYHNQKAENTGWLDDDLLTSAAESIPGLNVDRLITDRNSTTVTSRASAMDVQATAQGVRSTPTFLLGKTGAQPRQVTISAPSDAASLARAIDALLS